MASPLPFEHPPIGTVEVQSSKLVVNACFKWKEAKTDASGNVYDPMKVVEVLGMALAVLETREIINSDQKYAIIKELMQK